MREFVLDADLLVVTNDSANWNLEADDVSTGSVMPDAFMTDVSFRKSSW